jgi:hypothetical protein
MMVNYYGDNYLFRKSTTDSTLANSDNYLHVIQRYMIRAEFIWCAMPWKAREAPSSYKRHRKADENSRKSNRAYYPVIESSW